MESAQLAWNKLFVPSAHTVWRGEIPELRKAAILVHILNLEFERIKQTTENQLKEYRQILSAPEVKVGTEKLAKDQSDVLAKGMNSAFIKPSKQLHVEYSRDVQINEEPENKVTPKHETTKPVPKNSYVSPDLFGGDSPKVKSENDSINFSPKKVEGIVPIEQNGSPKINRNGYHRKFNRSKAFNFGNLKINEIKQKNREKNLYTPINETVLDDVIEGTPEPSVKKNLKRFPLSLNLSREKQKKTKYSNTLTQMYPQSLFKSKIMDKTEMGRPREVMDSEETLKDSFTVDEIVDYIDANKNKKHLDIEFEPECVKCNKWGSKCAKHRLPPTEHDNKTFTGFWDLTMNNNSEPESSPKFL